MGSHLYRSVIHLVCLVWVFETAPILIGHLHVNSMSVWVFRVIPIWIGHSFCQFSFSNRTYIDWSLSCQFVFGFLGSHLYWSAIFLSSYIRFWFLGPHLYWLIISMSVQFLEPHLHRSAIFLSICVQFDLGSYLYQLVIHLVNSVFKTAPMSICHSSCQFSFRDYTYIDGSFPC